MAGTSNDTITKLGTQRFPVRNKSTKRANPAVTTNPTGSTVQDFTAVPDRATGPASAKKVGVIRPVAESRRASSQ